MIFLKQKNCRYCNKTSQDFADFWDSVRILRLEQKWKIKEFEERKIVFFIIFAPLYYLSTVKVYSKLLLCEASNCDTHNISCHFGRYFTFLFWESICMPDITFRITYEEWWKKNSFYAGSQKLYQGDNILDTWRFNKVIRLITFDLPSLFCSTFPF